MSQLPSVELLESTHSFPCAFVFKVIGKVEGGFVARVVAAVRAELGDDVDPPYSMRQTTGGRHIAVTLEPHVRTAAQVVAIYQQIQRMDGVVMML